MTDNASTDVAPHDPDLHAALDDALDDLPRYMTVSQPEGGWLPGEPGQPVMKACVYVDDVREMLRRVVRRNDR
jgi:hypothetical protein